MKTSITITSKGQVTLPAYVRRQMGVADGGVLQIDFNEHQQRLVVTKPVSFEDIQAEAARYVKPGTKPLKDASGFYNAREPRV